MGLSQNIERLVLARRTAPARKFIAKYLDQSDFSHLSKVAACGWYRRLGLFREGYLLVALEEWKFSSLRDNPEKNLEALWMARFLNLMGATPYAAKVLAQLKTATVEEHRIAGNIWLSAGEFEESLGHFLKARDLDPDQLSYQHRFALLGISDSLSGLDREGEALDCLQGIVAKNGEDLLQGVLLTARGEILCKTEKFREALHVLRSAQVCFDQIDSSPDFGIYKKWLGYAQAKCGKNTEAQASFLEALRILKTPDHRAEAWLGVYDLMNKVGMLSGEESIYLGTYPGLSSRTLKSYGYETAWILGPGARKKADFEIYSDRGEWLDRGYPRFGIPLEVQLIRALKCSGSHGVSLVRLKSLLWPGEVSSFTQLDQRISKLLRRLRRIYGLQTRNQDGVATLDARSLSKVLVEGRTDSKLPHFFERNPEFEAREFSRYYGLGKTRTSILLKGLIAEKKLAVLKVNGKISYRVNLG